MNFPKKTYSILSLSCFLAACSTYNQQWPSLNAPLPDPAVRQHQRAPAAANTISSPINGIDTDTLDALPVDQLFTLIKKASHTIQTEVTALQPLLTAYKNETDTEEKNILWRSAQMAVTRVSLALDDYIPLWHSVRKRSSTPYTTHGTTLPTPEKLQQFLIDSRRQLNH